MPTDPPPNYYAYLVRFWRSDQNSIWRAMLHDPNADHPLRFESPDALYGFLQTQLGESPRVPTPAVSATNQDAVETKTLPDTL